MLRRRKKIIKKGQITIEYLLLFGLIILFLLTIFAPGFTTFIPGVGFVKTGGFFQKSIRKTIKQNLKSTTVMANKIFD